jgi:hypothetical protein
VLRPLKFLLVLLLSVSCFTSALFARAQSNTILYFSTEQGGLYRQELHSTELQQLNYEAGLDYAFSTDGQVAYWNDSGLWLSRLNPWQPTLVYRDREYYPSSLYWMPDSSQIVFSAEGRSGRHLSRTYVTSTHEVKSFPWIDCDSMAQERRSLSIGLVCRDPDNHSNAIVYNWKTEMARFSREDYTIIPGAQQGFEQTFDWNDDTLVFVDRRPDDRMRDPAYLYSPSYPQPRLVLTADDPGSILIAKLSPNNEFVALMELCRGGRWSQCLHIFRVSDGTTIWSYEQLPLTNILRPNEIIWDPISQRVAVLDNPVEEIRSPSVWIVDPANQSVVWQAINIEGDIAGFYIGFE